MKFTRRLATVGAVLATFVVTGLAVPSAASAAAPSAAAAVSAGGPEVTPMTATTCGYTCITVIGSGSHVDRVETGINVDPRFNSTLVGFLEVRWHRYGYDHFDHTARVFISNQYTTGINLNVDVDDNTYVCGRVWAWDGAGYYLVAGEDWKCIITHP
jgi:hypothetical protein